MKKDVLDVCCGSKMFWFDKNHPDVLFGDIRREDYTLCDGRDLHINPDILIDFTDLQFKDNSFSLVVFDPPHLVKAGRSGWQSKKYGVLPSDWKDYISKGFSECFRVLRDSGILIFKWNETQIKVREILSLTDVKPLFGNISGKRSNTHWVCFMKPKRIGE